jgi:hypothetical protein
MGNNKSEYDAQHQQVGSEHSNTDDEEGFADRG